MIYPSFLKEGSTIGIAAPSAGAGDDLEDWKSAMKTLHSLGYKTLETKSVRNEGARSADAKTRGEEVTSLFTGPEADFVMCASGGDFLDECLPYVDFDAMKAHPKWLMGASDPTGLLYPYTTVCDVATIYGMNAGSYAEDPLPDFTLNNLEILKGNMIVQKSWDKYMSLPRFQTDRIFYDKDSDMTCTEESLHVRGRCIGGCIDVLKDLIGTPYDGTKSFLARYENDGIIWYFDNFSQSAEVFYRTLLQMKYAGWFDQTRAVIIGRTCFPSSETGMTYEESAELALEKIPVIHRADVGHTDPHMTMINGAMMDLSYEDSRMEIRFDLKHDPRDKP